MNQPTKPDSIEDFVNDYEWRTDEFCHTPTERERDMLHDFAVMLAEEGTLADRAHRPAAPVVAEGLDINAERNLYDTWANSKNFEPTGWQGWLAAKRRAAHPVAGSPAEASDDVVCAALEALESQGVLAGEACGRDIYKAVESAVSAAFAAAAPVPASEAASLYEIQRDAAEQAVCANLVRLGLIAPAPLAAPAAPTDAKPDTWDAIALSVDEAEKQGLDYVKTNLLRRLLVKTRPLTAAQSVRDAAQPTIVIDWPYCNPGCDYEDPNGVQHDCRNANCVCEAAKASIARQRAASASATTTPKD